MAFASGAATALVYVADGFWAVSLHSLRVVFWWGREIISYYTASGGIMLSIAQPHSSWWSMVMFLGLILAVGAIVNDSQVRQQEIAGKSKSKSRSEDTLSAALYDA